MSLMFLWPSVSHPFPLLNIINPVVNQSQRRNRTEENSSSRQLVIPLRINSIDAPLFLSENFDWFRLLLEDASFNRALSGHSEKIVHFLGTWKRLLVIIIAEPIHSDRSIIISLLAVDSIFLWRERQIINSMLLSGVVQPPSSSFSQPLF